MLEAIGVQGERRIAKMHLQNGINEISTLDADACDALLEQEVHRALRRVRGKLARGRALARRPLYKRGRHAPLPSRSRPNAASSSADATVGESFANPTLDLIANLSTAAPIVISRHISKNKYGKIVERYLMKLTLCRGLRAFSTSPCEGSSEYSA